METELSGLQIELRLDPDRVCRWQRQLVATLSTRNAAVVVTAASHPASALPASVECLLWLERTLMGPTRQRLGEKAEWRDIPNRHVTGRAELMVDLGPESGDQTTTPVLRPLYDGTPGEAAIFAALLEGRAPLIEVERLPARTIVARGRPSLEGTRSIAEGYEIVAATVADFLLRVLDGSAPSLLTEEDYQSAPSTTVPEYLLRKMRGLAISRIYKLCCHSPHWRVGWRFVSDQDIWDRMDLGGVPWNTIPNPGLRFLADPFPLVWHGNSYVFVEDFDHRLGKGIISVVPFDEIGPSAAPVPVLEEPWHLSYPFLFEDGGDVWMIPESAENQEISLYRATAFPGGWKKEATLIKDVAAGDTTIVRHLGRLWMFTTVLNAGRSTDSLSIFTADKLVGPWCAHPRNPVLIDAAAARSAGNMILRKGSLWRPVQNCLTRYGGALGLAEITRLDDHDYGQIVRKVLQPSAEWPGRRLHTLNRSGRLECIDGSANVPRIRLSAASGL